MPRNSSGTYSLPPLNPVVTGTIIESDWANSTMEDIASSITNSLSRTGAGGMLAPLTHVNGTNLLPSITFLNDLQTGIFLDGIGNMTFTVSTQPLFRVSAANGVQVFIDGVW